MILAILWAPQISKFDSIIEGNTKMISYIMAPGITAVFLAGVLWKGASAKGAFITLISGTVMGVIIFFVDWFNEYTGWNYSFMLASFWLFLICCAILYFGSLKYPQVHTAESEKLVWSNPLAALREPGRSGILNYKFLSILLVAIIAVLYIIFD